MTRTDGRSYDALRPVKVEVGVQRFPEGSVIYRCGGTSVLIAASISDSVPDWMSGRGKGWVTGEYGMHPRSNPERQHREGRRGKVDGRAQEIQRLIGRALRAAVVTEHLGERGITLDCDVLDADGGTRTASITGAWIALVVALDGLRRRGLVGPGVLREPLAAVSVGLVNGRPMLDLCYVEDRDAELDLNVVGTASGKLVEVQGTAEGAPVARERFDELVDLALAGVASLAATQQAVLRQHGVEFERLLG